MTRSHSLILVYCSLFLFQIGSAQNRPVNLSGVWESTLRFGPDIRGPLYITRSSENFNADVAGFSVPVEVKNQSVSFLLPDGKGRFQGKMNGDKIVGHWIQPPTQYSGASYATPVTLQSDIPDRWYGVIAPLDDRFTYYIPVFPQPDGFRTYLRNPDRNQGIFVPV
ncbi:MAG TPA: hypothetical protein VHI78_13710, partial [Bacteroidales bacterium]|nr:hypothetical protein [Bacteroidales bacterium]